MARACCSSVRPACVGVTPWRPRTSSSAPNASLHLADAGRGRRQREIGALGAVGDAARLDDVAEQVEIGEIEAHGTAFLFDEGRLRKTHIAQANIQLLVSYCERSKVALAMLHERRSHRCARESGGADDAATGAESRPLSPHLQIYRPMLTMMMSIAHRITGAALYFGMLLLAWWLIAAASGPNAYANFECVHGQPDRPADPVRLHLGAAASHARRHPPSDLGHAARLRAGRARNARRSPP